MSCTLSNSVSGGERSLCRAYVPEGDGDRVPPGGYVFLSQLYPECFLRATCR